MQVDSTPFHKSAHSEFFRVVTDDNVRLVAKVLDSRSRRLRAIREHAELRHPNILQVREFAEFDDDRLFFK